MFFTLYFRSEEILCGVGERRVTAWEEGSNVHILDMSSIVLNTKIPRKNRKYLKIYVNELSFDKRYYLSILKRHKSQKRLGAK